MYRSTKRLARSVTPPILWKALSAARAALPLIGRSPGVSFVGNYRTWDEAASRCRGYAEGSILEKVLDATLRVARGEAEFERDSVVFDHIEYSWGVLAGLMWASTQSCGRLNVLDFGGSLGTTYFQNRKFLRRLSDVRWNVVEQPHYVAAGKTNLHEQGLQFYETIQECLLENRPNVILLSGVLQYLPEPFAVLSELLMRRVDAVILDRTCYGRGARAESIKTQRVPESIYSGSYPCRFFVETAVVQFIEGRGYDLLACFDSIDGRNSFASWKGHIFAARRSETMPVG